MNTQPLPARLLDLDADLPTFFLGHLASLVARQVASESPMERRALGRIAFAVFLDCLYLGMGEQAHAIIGQLRDEPRPVVRLVA